MAAAKVSDTERELRSQPECWRQAADLAARTTCLPLPDERVAIVGCGTSWFVAQCYASLRESRQQGVTDAFAVSLMPPGREYDRVVAVSRSGTTTEVLELLGSLTVPSVLLTATLDSPASRLADETVVLGFADERSVVQTRSATSALALLRAGLGEDLTSVIQECERALGEPIPAELVSAEQHTFLGDGWAYGLAQEAGLKMREAAGAWAEAYPAMEYRHGPIAVAQPGRVVWSLGPLPEGLADEVVATGATLVGGHRDPQVELVLAQRLAVLLAQTRGLDPDRPRNLSRSVILG